MGALVSVVWTSIFGSEVPRDTIHEVYPPPVYHVTLGDDVIQGRPVLIIGDVHGCYDELCELLVEARKHTNTFVPVFVGDIVNKGPKSTSVVSMVRGLGALSVRGNHDERCLRELKKIEQNANHEPTDKYKWVLDLTPDDRQYLMRLPYTISIPSINALLVHAGLVPGIALKYQSLMDMIMMRNIKEGDYYEGKGLIARNDVSDGVPWASLWPGPEHVYFGHDARRKLQIYPFATGLDTGCVYGGSLTAVLVHGNEKTFINIKAKETYWDP